MVLLDFKAHRMSEMEKNNTKPRETEWDNTLTGFPYPRRQISKHKKYGPVKAKKVTAKKKKFSRGQQYKPVKPVKQVKSIGPVYVQAKSVKPVIRTEGRQQEKSGLVARILRAGKRVGKRAGNRAKEAAKVSAAMGTSHLSLGLIKPKEVYKALSKEKKTVRGSE